MRLALAALAATVMLAPSLARDLGQWEATDAHVRHWFQSLMRPDWPSMSCCGEADAYWADSFEAQGENFVAIITDEREDAPLRRPHHNPGERIVVPKEKMKWDQGNPTGHGVIFLGPGETIYCYVVPGGV